ncbi:unnamed protein product [Paramecium primaurelia]|uniref:Uncharacterized protein n=1 Tax=Paramecium primaurelia TaxID=5886 RepID=A0A8S1NV85_PARPR|nr:unnamed protein product [Paramecium primaurelia]
MLESVKKSAINFLISQDDQAQFYEYKYFIGQFNPKNDQDK